MVGRRMWAARPAVADFRGGAATAGSRGLSRPFRDDFQLFLRPVVAQDRAGICALYGERKNHVLHYFALPETVPILYLG